MVIYLSCQKYGSAAVVKYYVIPWLAVTHWFIMYVSSALGGTLLKTTLGSHIYTTPILYSPIIGILSGRSKGELQRRLIGTLIYDYFYCFY
jgi:hypothetical protein